MARNLVNVAEQIVDENRTMYEVVNVAVNSHSTAFVDFRHTVFGVDWGATDLGDWEIFATSATSADGENVTRIWFREA